MADLFDAGRQGVRVSGVDQEAGVADDLGEGAALFATTGSPIAMASMTGTPKPSCWEATARTSEVAMASTRSSSLTWPRKVTAWRRPSSSTKRSRALE